MGGRCGRAERGGTAGVPGQPLRYRGARGEGARPAAAVPAPPPVGPRRRAGKRLSAAPSRACPQGARDLQPRRRSLPSTGRRRGASPGRTPAEARGCWVAGGPGCGAVAAGVRAAGSSAQPACAGLSALSFPSEPPCLFLPLWHLFCALRYRALNVPAPHVYPLAIERPEGTFSN